MHASRSRAFLTLCILLGLTSCGTLAPAPTRTLVAPRPTLAPAPTPTPPPSATRPPAPTARPSTIPPTDTPRATVEPTVALTASPSAAPKPTRAPTDAPEATATPEIVLTPLSDLPNRAGQEVTVQANVVWISSFSAGFRFLLDDGTGRATLLLWTNVYQDCWAAPKLLYGASVQARGTVSQYEGAWQVEPDFGGDVKALVVGGLPPARQAGSVSTADVGTVVTVEGTVSRAEAFSQGQRVYVEDGSGTLMLLLWQNVYDLVKDNALLLTPGTRVRAGGIVEEYKGTLELVPQVPYAVIVNP